MALPIAFEKIQSDKFGRIPTVGGELENAFNGNFDKINFELQGLQSQIGAAGYESFSISSFTNSVEFAQLGSIINSIRFDWSYVGNIAKQSITPDAPNLNAAQRTVNVTGLSVATNRTWTLRADDGTTEIQRTTSLTFLNSMYYGVSVNENLTNSQVLSLNAELGTSFEQTRFFNCSGGRFIFLAFPTTWGTPVFRVGGMTYSAMEKTTIPTFQNSTMNHTLSLDVYRIGSKQFGSNIMVEVFKA
jgi:hypothetical protein